MKRVAFIFTGGTISMAPDAEAGGFRPVHDGEALLDRAPRVREIANVEAVNWGLVPASHMRFGQILEIARLIDHHARRPQIDGVVVVQGTDTLEEMAFAFDLLVGGDKPVVVTGAMRDASSPEYDGPRNLADAAACAASDDLVGAGVVVTFGGLIIPADDAVKTHSTALETFGPRDGVALGEVSDGVVRVDHTRARRSRIDPFPAEAVDDVYLVTAVAGLDGTIVRGLAPLRPRGLVVAATGSGNTSPDLLAAAGELMAEGTVVCLSTRCPTGMVDPRYAFAGGGATWQRAGALMSRFDGPKTRVAVALALGAGYERAAIADLIAL